PRCGPPLSLGRPQGSLISMPARAAPRVAPTDRDRPSVGRTVGVVATRRRPPRSPGLLRPCAGDPARAIQRDGRRKAKRGEAGAGAGASSRRWLTGGPRRPGSWIILRGVTYNSPGFEGERAWNNAKSALSAKTKPTSTNARSVTR